jgi:hypothetical protein
VIFFDADDFQFGFGAVKHFYDGEWNRDYRHGKGKFTWPELGSFEGMFLLNSREGFGIMSYLSGHIFRVTFYYYDLD